MARRKILYNACYGGFSINDTAKVELKRVFPDLIKSEQKPDFIVQRIQFEERIRDRQDIIDYMLKNGGVARFSGESSDIRVADIPAYVDYHIREYDGKEWVQRKIPYEKVIDDMVNMLKEGESHTNKSVFTDLYLRGDKEKIKQLLLS